MPDPAKAGLATDLNAGDLVSDESIERLVSRKSARSGHDNLNREDVDQQVDIEKAEAGDTASLSSDNDLEPSATSDKIILSFSDDDPENPYAWSSLKKAFVLCVSIVCVMNSTVSSGLASNSAPFFSQEFGVSSNAVSILPTSLFLLGYVIGPVVFGPMSEQYGRKVVSICAFVFFAIWTMASALSPNMASLVIFRFLCGIGAACPIVVVGGTCADIFKSPVSRGRAMAVFMGATTFGPCAGPVISGYISPIKSWRWSFWIGLMFAGIGLVPLVLVPETYGPVLLKKRAQNMRKESGNVNIRAPIELEKEDLRHIVTMVLTRPIRMFIFEPIVLFSCLYLSFVYGVFYMMFQVFPVVYIQTYGFTLGQEGLTFLSIGVGACFAIVFYLWWDSITKKARTEEKNWVKQEEMRRLPLACAGGPFFMISCFWLGWTARESVHWAVPVSSGIFFGIGYLLIFMSILNYLVDAYKIFAASGEPVPDLAEYDESVLTVYQPWQQHQPQDRSLDVCCPLEQDPVSQLMADQHYGLFGTILIMLTIILVYDNLGVPWACSLLGFLSLLMACIPFVFIWQGENIRSKSRFCQYLLQKEIEEEENKQRRADRERKRRAKEEAAHVQANATPNGSSKEGAMV